MKTKWSSEHWVQRIASAPPRPHYYYLARALRDGNSLLEVGCGASALWDFLAPLTKGVNYTGADLTSEMLESSRKRFPDNQFIETDVQELSNVPNDSYDWVVCSDVLIHVPDPYAGLQQLWRVTGGALLLVIRESTFPEDINDIDKAYQPVDGMRYHYNVWNIQRTGQRLRQLVPAPQAMDAYRCLFRAPESESSPRFAFDQNVYPVWASTYVLLKDPRRVAWLGSRDWTFDRRNLLHRAVRKFKRLFVGPERWDPLPVNGK